MIYNNTEFYVQDNWKASNRLTLDYGMRFTRQQPQYDQFQPDVELLPGAVDRRRRRRALCTGAAYVWRHDLAFAMPMDPRTGQILTVPGAAEHAGGDRHADPRLRAI